jgi:aminocarboxymuconate-semialdehyde decarboxylase
MLGRLDKGYELTRAYGGKLTRKPSEHARHLFYDSNVYDIAYLRHLIQRTAPGHVFLGTDYPFALMQTDPLAYLGRAELNDAELESVGGSAARAFLNA